MAKEFIQKLIDKYIPDPDVIKNHKSLSFLGEKLHEPNLWHINRHSITKAFAIGLFFAWLPAPTQMAFAAAAAVFLRAHLLISVALVWISNPITIPAFLYVAYRTGIWYSHHPSDVDNFSFTLDGISSGLGDLLAPTLLGCLVLGLLSALLGYISIDQFWRHHVSKKWLERRQNRLK
jgi:uncharacterized protein